MSAGEQYGELIAQAEKVHGLMEKNYKILKSPYLLNFRRAEVQSQQRELRALFDRIIALIDRLEADLVVQGFTFED